MNNKIEYKVIYSSSFFFNANFDDRPYNDRHACNSAIKIICFWLFWLLVRYVLLLYWNLLLLWCVFFLFFVADLICCKKPVCSLLWGCNFFLCSFNSWFGTLIITLNSPKLCNLFNNTYCARNKKYELNYFINIKFNNTYEADIHILLHINLCLNCTFERKDTNKM